MLIRPLAGLAGLLLLLGLVACGATPTPTAPPAPTATLATAATASPVPPTAASPVPPSATPPPPPTPTVSPASPTAVTLPFDAGLDQAGLEAMYAQAEQQVGGAAPDADLSQVQMDLAPGQAARVRFDFYAPSKQVVYQVRFGPEDTPPVSQDPAPAPVDTFATPPWLRNPRWPLLVAEAARQAQAPAGAAARWTFQVTARAGGPDWELTLLGAFRFVLRDGAVTMLDPASEQPVGTPTPVPPGEDLPFGFLLNNAAVDRYHQAAGRLVTQQASDAALQEVTLRFGDPADAGAATILYRFYSARRGQAYQAIFDTSGRRDVTPIPGSNGPIFRESTPPWAQVPTWPGLLRLAAGAMGTPAGQVQMLATATAAQPGAWSLQATVTRRFVLTGETVTSET